MLHPAFKQVSQNTVVFNENPSRELWDVICTSMCSVPFPNIKFNCANNYLVSWAACHCDQQLQLLEGSLEVSLNSLTLLRMQT